MIKRVVVAFVSLGLAFAPFGAYGQSTQVLVRQALTGFSPSSTGPGYVRVVSSASHPVSARVWSAASGRKINASDTVSIATPGGALVVTSKASTTFKDAAIAVASCLGSVAVCAVVTAATAAYALYNARRSAAGELERDVGTPQVQEEAVLWKCSGSQGYTYTSPVAACEAAYAPLSQNYNAQCEGGANAQMNITKTFAVLSTTTNNVATVRMTSTTTRLNNPPNCANQGAYVAYTDLQANGNPTYTMVCPAIGDLPKGRAPRPDGLCSTGTYVATTPQALGDLADAYPPTTASWGSGEGGAFVGGGASDTWRNALKEAVEQGVQTPAEITTTGPASLPGPSTTTTMSGPDGTTTTVTTPTYNYGYPAGGNITQGTTTTTQVTAPNGTVTTTTSTTGPAPVTAPTTSGSTQPSPTDCQLFPTIIGCQQPGEATEPTHPAEDAPITFSPTPFSQSAGCPAPFALAFNISGQAKSYSISNQPLCDLMVTLNPIFTALFAAAAAMIFYQGLSRIKT